MSTHEIKRGDTLSVLAKRYNTDVSTLQRLNAQQIKDIDLIYDGKTLVIPDVSDLTSGEREEKQILSSEKLQLTECSKPQFVDALYVPEHPNTQKQMLILLTEEAKKYIVEDDKRCKAALEGDKETVLKQLTKLGVMDQFNSIAHEAFLKRISADKANDYRNSLLEHRALSICCRENELNFPQENPRIGLVKIESRIAEIENQYQHDLDDVKKLSNGAKWLPIEGTSFGEVMLTKDAIAGVEAKRISQLKKLQKKLLNKLKKNIQDFEKEAIDFAAKTSISEEGHHYEFSTKHAYYSSNVDLKIYKALETVKKERHKLGLDDSITKEQLTVDTPIPSLEKAYKSYKYWRDYADPVLNRLSNQKYKWNPRSFITSSNADNRLDNPSFYAAVYQLNQTGTLLKEQCLTENQLFKGWAQVETVRSAITEKRASISDLKSLLDSINKSTPVASEMGYYAVYTLNLMLLREVALRIKEFSELIGENLEYAKYVKALFRYAELAQQRFDDLLQIAEENTKKPQWNYQKEQIKFAGEIPYLEETTRTVIVRESQWQPRNLNNQIFVDSGMNQRTVVECAFSSDPTTRLYILSDSPVLSSDLSENKKCTSIVNLNLSSSAGREKGKISDGLKSALGSEAVLSSLKFEQTASWANVEDIVFPWQMKRYENEMFGINTAYETSGGAQFARYVYSAGTGIDHEVLSSDKLSLKADFSLGLSLASVERTVKLRFPSSGEMSLDIPYRIKDSKERKTQNIGTSVLNIEGKVYGIVGASLKLGTQLHIGNIEENSEGFGEHTVKPLGIKGTVPSKSDYSSYYTSAIGNREVKKANIAAGVKAEASAFAGLEAGGMLSCSYDWTKDQKTPKQNLFKVSQGFKMSAGLGYDGVFQCTFHNGRFVFITALGASTGLGIGGKFATELNPQAADDFFAALLGVMENKGFQRFEFFDESGKVNTFAEFNKVLTVAAAFGLTIGQVLMLPFNIISQLEEQASNKDNAYFVANFILSKEHEKENQKWITKMPAETLAKLLSVLIHYNDIPVWGDSSKAIAATRNENQRKAINKILLWLGGDKADNSGIHRFENALQRMGLKQPTELNKSEQWQRYANNVISLRDFFLKAYSQPYEKPKDDKKNNYMNRLNTDYRDFRSYLLKLTMRNKILEKTSYTAGRISHFRKDYTVLPANSVERLEQFKSLGYQLTNWLPEK
ncbi:LysM peptidoglycan-binding domain-containing protein [Vibrio hepatarius]|jgi:hypothetical protein|uniref:Peptidoglycan-binding protein LysM n=1 Tax=Vibrio hepatarius TaxID=171383 RepID=A0A0M0HZY1_9VIBR|nr:LysM domain-containing protein [Vibrio hepatarius]KOO07630.1 peptidoglycan-binding protein LysM [Vibrio hepatarius]